MSAIQETVQELRRRVRILEQALEKARVEAETDKLTGLLNPLGLQRRIADGGGGWYVMADLNGFKLAQDAHPDGHDHGDMLLQEFARFLVRKCRMSEDQITVRKGGDEFLVLCPSHRGAQRICAMIRRWKCGGVTASCGLGTTIKRADRMMYKDKRRNE